MWPFDQWRQRRLAADVFARLERFMQDAVSLQDLRAVRSTPEGIYHLKDACTTLAMVNNYAAWFPREWQQRHWNSVWRTRVEAVAQNRDAGVRDVVCTSPDMADFRRLAQLVGVELKCGSVREGPAPRAHTAAERMFVHGSTFHR